MEHVAQNRVIQREAQNCVMQHGAQNRVMHRVAQNRVMHRVAQNRVMQVAEHPATAMGYTLYPTTVMVVFGHFRYIMYCQINVKIYPTALSKLKYNIF